MFSKILKDEEKRIIAKYFEFPDRNGGNEIIWDLNLVGWCINKMNEKELEIFLLFIQNNNQFTYGELIKNIFDSNNFFHHFLKWREKFEVNK